MYPDGTSFFGSQKRGLLWLPQLRIALVYGIRLLFSPSYPYFCRKIHHHLTCVLGMARKQRIRSLQTLRQFRGTDRLLLQRWHRRLTGVLFQGSTLSHDGLLRLLRAEVALCHAACGHFVRVRGGE